MHKLSADAITYNSAISACEKLGQWTIALDLMRGMMSFAILPNGVTMSAAISATVQAGKWQQAIHLYQQLEESEVPAVIASNSMLAAFEASSQWQRALSVLHAMSSSLAQADTITYSVVLAACQKSLQWRYVLELVRRLPDECALDTRVCASAIDACAMGAQAGDAVRLLETLVQVVQL